VDQPRRRLDPLAVAIHAIAIAAIVGIGAFLLFQMRSAPDAPTAASQDRRLENAVAEIRDWLAQQRIEPSAKPEPPAAKPGPSARQPPTPQSPVAAIPPAQYPKDQISGPLLPLEADRVWRYAVTVDPPTWRDAVLTYRVPRENGRLVVYTDFTHAGGTMRFKLGALEAGDPAHANVRFPGFFLHSAYVNFPLVPGQRVSWSWPWQLAGGGVRRGRIKQFDGEVRGWEMLKVPSGTYNAVRIDALIKYIEAGKVEATSRETIWIAPKVWGVLKVVREGVAPDEGFRRIVAELSEFR
jgi:hypothetical protein